MYSTAWLIKIPKRLHNIDLLSKYKPAIITATLRAAAWASCENQSPAFWPGRPSIQFRVRNDKKVIELILQCVYLFSSATVSRIYCFT